LASRFLQRVRSWGEHTLLDLRLRLAHPEALLLLSLLGLVSGVLAGSIIVAFRVLVEGTQAALLPGGEPESYESLVWWARLSFPLVGGLAIGLLFVRLAKTGHVVGVARVIERLAYHQGHISLRELVLQFIGAVFAIVSGHSVGREGPNVFLGAAGASLLGQHLGLPNNSIRTLVGCGTAAGIAASFNTPLAGVIFALEVVMMEYTLASFIPVILAAFSADAISVYFFGPEPVSRLLGVTPISLGEIPLIVLLGLFIGGVAAAFNQSLESLASHTGHLPIWVRTTLAGLLVGLCGLILPEVLGIGYDSVEAMLQGQLAAGLLAALVAGKLVATACSVGLGIPGGLIGPSLFIGAAGGGLVGFSALSLFPEIDLSPGLYSLLGLGAMMGASLQAPLAALTAMVELTHTPQIIMPGMLAIVIATLVTREVFGKGSVFQSVLKGSGMDRVTSPVLQALRRVGVASVMERRFARCERTLARTDAEAVLRDAPEWLLFPVSPEKLTLLRAVELARHLRESERSDEVDLMEIPGKRLEATSIHLEATLQEAVEKLARSGAEAAYVERMIAPTFYRTYGVLTRDHIETAYRY